MDRVYAIGDIHGRLDLLDRAIDAIDRDVAAHGPAMLTVTLGDYVDRGPNSAGVIGRLAVNPFPTDYVALKGNHEALLQAFLANPAGADIWRRNGGLETLNSYRVPVADVMMGRDFDVAAKVLAEVMPPSHRVFLDGLRTSHVVGRYFFCHAGVRPGIPLAQQSEDDLLWIREEFLSSAQDFGSMVVHGHTPVAEPEVRPNRINIDTGAFATSRLTCVALDGDGHRFLKV